MSPIKQAIEGIWMAAISCVLPLPEPLTREAVDMQSNEAANLVEARRDDSIRRLKMAQSPEEINKVMAAILQEAADVANGRAPI